MSKLTKLSPHADSCKSSAYYDIYALALIREANRFKESVSKFPIDNLNSTEGDKIINESFVALKKLKKIKKFTNDAECMWNYSFASCLRGTLEKDEILLKDINISPVYTQRVMSQAEIIEELKKFKEMADKEPLPTNESEVRFAKNRWECAATSWKEVHLKLNTAYTIYDNSIRIWDVKLKTLIK